MFLLYYLFPERKKGLADIYNMILTLITFHVVTSEHFFKILKNTFEMFNISCRHVPRVLIVINES